MVNKLWKFFKNLIVSLGLVVIVMMILFTTRSYAAYTLGQAMRENVSVWYLYILRVCLTIYAIGYLIIVLKLLADRTPERLKILKESILRFFIMFIVIYFLHYIMLAIIMLNGEGLKTAKAVGTTFSGIDMVHDEDDLYETALSKAYELAAVPGFVGLLMYLLLVYYTYKFAIVYAKRFINVIILILIAPVIFVISTIRKILTGSSDGKIGKWFKEFIFNVIIQTFHAIFYAILIGLTLKLSDNDENLIGALLTLILFGFIFKIDGIIRKIFNFVGGSTKINSSKAVGTAINTVGGAVSGGLNGIGGAAETFGDNLEKHGLKDGLKETGSDIKNYFGNKVSKAGDGIKQLPSNIKQKTINVGLDIKDKAATAFASAKADAKDFTKIMNGERVKANLTADELVAAEHDLEATEGLMGLRNKVQQAGSQISAQRQKLGKSLEKRIARAYATLDGRAKLAIAEAQQQFEHDVYMLENNVEMVKRIPTVVKRTAKFLKKKKIRTIKKEDGMNVDVTNTMMLVVDTEISPVELAETVREKLGKGMDIEVYAFEQIGAQIFLSPAVGSPRMGMAVLAEENYEDIAEHSIEEAITGKKRKKRTIQKASSRTSKKEIRSAASLLQKDKQLFNKTYRFSRFNPNTARKITKKMLKKSREQNRYIVVINKAYDDIQINNMKARGTIARKTTEIVREVRATRKTFIRSIRQIKLSQMQAIGRYRAIERQTRRVEMANQVAGNIMNARNVVKLGFKQIDHMTSGQIGLRKMIKEGKAKELSSGLIALRETATVQEKVKTTGIMQPEKEIVLQFVVGDAGELVKQAVTTDGRVIQSDIKEQTVQHIVTLDGKIIKQVVDGNGMIDASAYQIMDNGGDRLVSQIQSVLSNEDVGLKKTATLEERTKQFEVLLQDVKRIADTQYLLEQVLDQSTPEEREVDEILVAAMGEAGISTISELKQHMHFEEGPSLDEEFLQKTKVFERAVTEQMISTGIVTPIEAEDEDTMERAFGILNERVATLSATDSELLLDTAAEMERTRIAEELINKGEFTIQNPPTDEDIDSKMGDLSDLLSGLAKDYIEETVKFPREVLKDTVKYTAEVIENAAEGTKSDAEIAFEKELKKAEKRWAKKHGVNADESIVEKYKKREKGEEDSETVKISLKFFGGVETQGQTVTLSNRYSIKDYYDKANKLDHANLEKTQARFLQIYGDKLEEMQLMPFSFAKHPVEEMDEWSIYVVTDEEDVTPNSQEEKPKDTVENIEIRDLIDLYYIELKKIFTEFVIENKILSFDELYKDAAKHQELIRRIRLLLFRRGEIDEHAKAKAIVYVLDRDVRFKNLLKEAEIEILAQAEGEERREKAKSAIKVTSKEDAEKTASSRMTKEEESRFRKEEKADLVSQVLDDAVAEQRRKARQTSDNDLNQLLNELDANKAYISVGQEDTRQNRKTLNFETNGGK